MKSLKIFLAAAVLFLGLGLIAYAEDSGPDMGAGSLNINTATVEQLKMIPYIDSRTAESIVNYRDSHGPFTSVDELLKVKGISRPLLEDLRSHVVLKGESDYNPYGTF